VDIAPKFTEKDWKSLDLDGNEADWQRAIDVLESRICSRYLDPVDKLIEFESDLQAQDRRFGFTVLAIDLLLIETLQAFKEGHVSTKGKSKKVFTRFLSGSPYFRDYFRTKEQCTNFYSDFRCGILHQAEIQSSALLWSCGDLYERAGEMEVLNRNVFHEKLSKDFFDYIGELRKPSSDMLRQNFKRKMDFIATAQDGKDI
jgi:hypothetical protein